MSFTRRLAYFLVHTLNYTNKQAKELIKEGSVIIDGVDVRENSLLEERSEIRVKGEVVRAAKNYIYFKFNKPAGYECSLNEKVPDNIKEFFQPYSDLSIAGRLDKASEGLL